MSRISPDLLAGILEPREVRISPDGTRVVFSTRTSWVRKSEYIQSALWIADIGQENSARQLTTDDYRNHSAQFSPDGGFISFISDRAKPGQAAGLYLLPLSGGEAIPLTAKENEMGIGTYKWRCDSKAIAYTSPDEKSDERKQREKDKNDVKVYGQDLDFAKLRIIDTDTKEVTTLKSINGHVTNIAWSQDCSKIAYTTTSSPIINDIGSNNRLCVVDIANDTSKELYMYEAAVSDLCWYNNRLLWKGPVVAAIMTSAQAVISISSEEPSNDYTIVSHGVTDCVGELKHSHGKVVMHVKRGLTDILESIDATELYQEKIEFKGWDAQIESSQTTLAIVEGKVGVPAEVCSIKAGVKVKLSRFGEHIAAEQMGTSRLLEYTRDDGTPMDGLYAIPSNLLPSFRAHKPQPTVVVVHGGPYSRVTDSFDLFFHFTTFLMSLEYLVLCPNFRGGSGHGHRYANSIQYDASKSYQDVIWLLRRGIDEGYVHPDRVAILGWSYGGYLAYLSLTRDSDFHFRAAIAGAGITDWTTMLYTSDVFDYASAISGPKPWDMDMGNDLTSRRCSPIFHMRAITTPLLIIHGEDDQRVPLEQAVGFYRGMKELGKDVTMLAYPHEGHGDPIPWTKTHYIDMLDRIEDFLRKRMG